MTTTNARYYSIQDERDESLDDQSASEFSTPDERNESTLSGLTLTSQDTVTSGMRQSKAELKDEVEKEMKSRRCLSTCATVLHYLRADQTKE